MNRLPVVTTWARPSGENYDAFLACVGYEARSRFIAEVIRPEARRRVASIFSDRQVLSFDTNLSWYRSSGYELEEHDDEGYRAWVERVLARIFEEAGWEPRICVDISSLSRVRIAILVDSLFSFMSERSIEVDFLYSLASFSSPPASTEPNTHVGPVIPEFAGWTNAPERPPVAVVGLGYEEDRALGAVEHIQASFIWAFMPTSSISAYGPALESANRTLMQLQGLRKIRYIVEQPFDCFLTLEAVTYGCLQEGNPILLPFGPKIFALNSVLVAGLHPEVAVWRVSAGGQEPAAERVASGTVIGHRVMFRTTKTNSVESDEEESEIQSQTATW
jgi:hypothetical protein